MPEPRKSNTSGHVRKATGLRGTNIVVDGLTCSEGQVEDLLSEGESTEAERTVPVRSSKQAARKVPARS